MERRKEGGRQHVVAEYGGAGRQSRKRTKFLAWGSAFTNRRNEARGTGLRKSQADVQSLLRGTDHPGVRE